MPRFILKAGYMKKDSGKNRGNFVNYLATRDGVEIPTDKRDIPATKKQKQLIAELLDQDDSLKTLYEYEDYIGRPTAGSASDFLTLALEAALEKESPEIYTKYIATRPGVIKESSHGLFGMKPIDNLQSICDEVEQHKGYVWTLILSVRREDAEETGMLLSESWRDLIRENQIQIAKEMKIPMEELCWYGAFHNEGHHPHAHVVVYAKNPKRGYLSKESLQNLRSLFARRIFRVELQSIYEDQTRNRDKLVKVAGKQMRALCHETKENLLRAQRSPQEDDAEQEIDTLVLELAHRLSKARGKKIYGYLSPENKELVDRITDYLGEHPDIAELYGLWQDNRQDVLHTYSDKTMEKKPLSREKELKQVRNLVVQEAVTLGERLTMPQTEPQEATPFPTDADAPSETEVGFDHFEPYHSLSDDELADFIEPPLSHEPREYRGTKKNSSNKLWTKQYKQARLLLFGNKETKPQPEEARLLMEEESLTENPLALRDLARMTADGLGGTADPEKADKLYGKALLRFRALEQEDSTAYLQYRIGKMAASGLGMEQDDTEAVAWFEKAAEQKHKYASYSLACHLENGRGLTQDLPRAYALFLFSAKQDNPYAMGKVAQMLESGKGTEASPEKANQWYQQAYHAFEKMTVELSDDKLLYRLGKMNLNGKGVPINCEKALSFFLNSAKLGNVYGMESAARLLLEQDDPAKKEEATTLLRSAAKAGNASAAYSLAELLSAPEQREEQLLWYQQALTAIEKTVTEKPSVYLLRRLANIYKYSKGCESNPDKVKRYTEEAAQLGDPSSMYALAKILIEEGAEEPALHWLEQAGNLRHGHGAYLLATKLEEKIADPEQVQKWYGVALQDFHSKASDKPDAFVLCRVSWMHGQGKGTPIDKEKALNYLTQAANMKDAYACYELGRAFYFGSYSPSDKETAKHWLSLSVSLWSVQAQTFLLQMHQREVDGLQQSSLRLLVGLTGLFEDKAKPMVPASAPASVDHKLLAKIRQKKLAMGQKLEGQKQR